MDVRSPKEFSVGHIPGAISFPLFDDAERAVVGTLYKQKGKIPAVLAGLEIVGPKLMPMVSKALESTSSGPIYVHCWRGGMRSAAVAMLLETIGVQCFTLRGGYKAYRNFILKEFTKPWNFMVIGGKTGSGKTEILRELAKLGEQVIDLEALAHHKGSAFGKIGEMPQPESEQFGNNLYETLKTMDASQTIWVEDESHTIGSVFIPTEFYTNYRKSPLIVLEIPFQHRVQNLVRIYGSYNLTEIEEAFRKIERKLGGLQLKTALEFLNNHNLEAAAEIALRYYDKTYNFGLQNKDTDKISTLSFESNDPKEIAISLMKTNKESTKNVNQKARQ